MSRVQLLAFVALCLVSSLAQTTWASQLSSSGEGPLKRSLLQKDFAEEVELTPAEKEKEREQNALDDFREFQAIRNAEKERLVVAATDEAEDLRIKFATLNTGGQKKKILKNLWKNGKGLVISHLLKFSIEDGDGEEVTELILKAMEESEDEGFAITVAEAVSTALTVVLEDGEANHFVDMLAIRMKQMNKEEKGSGCAYIRFMLLDAETFAISNSREIDLTLAIDDPRHTEIAECFFDPCEGQAAKCCASEESVSNGLCGCGKGKQARVCNFNLFSNQPRPIWLCNTSECEEFQKCLCPSEKKLSKLVKALKKSDKKNKKNKKNNKKGAKKNKAKKNSSKKKSSKSNKDPKNKSRKNKKTSS